MTSQADKPTANPKLADEAASLVAAAEDLAKWAASQGVKNLDFTLESLGRLDKLLERLSGSKDPIGLKTRLGCAAYVGEVLVRRLGGSWGTGENYGEVLPPGAAGTDGSEEGEPENLARPTEMVERRLVESLGLQQQVLEQSKAWSATQSPAAEAAPEPEVQPVTEPEPATLEPATAEQAEADRLAAEKAAAEKAAAEQAEADRLAADKLAADQAEADRLAADKLAAEKAAADQAEVDRLAAEKAAADQAEVDRLAAEKAAAEKAAADQAEVDRLAAEKAAADQAEVDRLAAEKAAAEKAAADQAEVGRLAAEKAAAEKAAAEQAEANRLAAEKLAAEQAEANRLAAEKLAAEQAATMMRLVAETFVGPATANGAVWLDYSPASVMLLDDLIAAWWPATPEKGTYESMIPAMGAYIGEVLVRQAGGRWIRDPAEGYAVDVNGRVVFPMKQVAGRFELGRTQSIGRFYTGASSGSAPAPEPSTDKSAKKRGFFHRRG